MTPKSDTISTALSYFDQGYACSQSVLLAFANQFNLDEQTAKLISSTFGGGMGRLRLTCGALTGGFMVLGLAYGNDAPNDLQTKLSAYQKVRKLHQQMKEIHGTTICKELLQKYTTREQVEERKHHKVICRRLVGEVAGLLYDMLETNNNQ